MSDDLSGYLNQNYQQVPIDMLTAIIKGLKQELMEYKIHDLFIHKIVK
jgi:hypothetical protein